MKKLIRILLVLLVLLVAAFFIFRTPDTDREAMIAKYSNDASQFVDDGVGGKIHYRDEGNREGIPILFVHGSNSMLQTWEPLVPLLKDRYRLISFDMHGHGLTGPHTKGVYGADTNIAAATTVLDALGVDKAFWVRSSMGGWVSWRAGLAVPERVQGLVLVGASGAQVEEKIEPYLGARIAQSSLGQLIMPHITPEFLVRSSLEETVADPDGLTDEQVARYWELLRFPGNRQAAVDRANAGRQPEKWQEVGTLKMPVLLIWGEQDYVVPVSHGRAFEAGIPGSKLIVYPDAGHLPMEETPQQVARDISAWIETVTSGADDPNPEA